MAPACAGVRTTEMTSRARPLATAAATRVSSATASRLPQSMPKRRRPATSRTTACTVTVRKTRGELAAEDRRRRRRRGEHARQGAVAVLVEDRARHVGGAEEHEEDHHAGEDRAGDADVLGRPRRRQLRRALRDGRRPAAAPPSCMKRLGGLLRGVVGRSPPPLARPARRGGRGRPRPVEVEQRLADDALGDGGAELLRRVHVQLDGGLRAVGRAVERGGEVGGTITADAASPSSTWRAPRRAVGSR